MVADQYGLRIDLADLRHRFFSSLKGAMLARRLTSEYEFPQQWGVQAASAVCGRVLEKSIRTIWSESKSHYRMDFDASLTESRGLQCCRRPKTEPFLRGVPTEN